MHMVHNEYIPNKWRHESWSHLNNNFINSTRNTCIVNSSLEGQNSLLDKGGITRGV